MQHTALITVKDAWHSHQVQRHAKLRIGLNVQWLLPRKARGKARCGVLTARKSSIRDVEELGRNGWWRERIRVSNPGNEILMDHALAAARL